MSVFWYFFDQCWLIVKSSLHYTFQLNKCNLEIYYSWYCFSCWRNEIWQLLLITISTFFFMVTVSAGDTHSVSSKGRNSYFWTKKVFLVSKKFFQNHYKQPWLSCWLLAYALQVLWEVSARWTLLLQVPTCPCWQSVFVPFPTPQLWAMMAVLNIFIGQSLSDHNSAVMNWTEQVESVQVNSFPLDFCKPCD